MHTLFAPGPAAGTDAVALVLAAVGSYYFCHSLLPPRQFHRGHDFFFPRAVPLAAARKLALAVALPVALVMACIVMACIVMA